jgi:hypothetical protein
VINGAFDLLADVFGGGEQPGRRSGGWPLGARSSRVVVELA